jgi:acetoin utilization deacetylase AcuC-like enzyme
MDVIYSPAMVAPDQSFSPSAAKPAAVMVAWLDAIPRLAVLPPLPATMDDLLRAHQRRYVEDIIALRRPNGFGSHSELVNASLWQTNGAMLSAARRALATGKPVAAPCSGFHHAGWDFGGGFCTFNGLMVSALALLHDDPKLRIGILDYDYHEGNGTANILDHLNPLGIVHITAGAQWTEPEQASAFLANIRNDLEALSGCNLVLYQAGADPHIDDPLGGFLTTAQLAIRDWRVFEGLAARGIPVAWNLAGGYQKPLSKVVGLHLTSLRLCIESGASHTRR